MDKLVPIHQAGLSYTIQDWKWKYIESLCVEKQVPIGSHVYVTAKGPLDGSKVTYFFIRVEPEGKLTRCLLVNKNPNEPIDFSWATFLKLDD